MTEGTCLVGRKFDAAGSEFTLGIRKAASTDDFQLLIWRPKRSTEVSKGRAQLTFDRMSTIEARYRRGPVTIPGLELTEIATDRAKVGPLSRANILHVRAGDLTISFNMRGAGGAFRALADCEKGR